MSLFHKPWIVGVQSELSQDAISLACRQVAIDQKPKVLFKIVLDVRKATPGIKDPIVGHLIEHASTDTIRSKSA